MKLSEFEFQCEHLCCEDEKPSNGQNGMKIEWFVVTGIFLGSFGVPGMLLAFWMFFTQHAVQCRTGKGGKADEDKEEGEVAEVVDASL